MGLSILGSTSPSIHKSCTSRVLNVTLTFIQAPIGTEDMNCKPQVGVFRRRLWLSKEMQELALLSYQLVLLLAWLQWRILFRALASVFLQSSRAIITNQHYSFLGKQKGRENVSLKALFKKCTLYCVFNNRYIFLSRRWIMSAQYHRSHLVILQPCKITWVKTEVKAFAFYQVSKPISWAVLASILMLDFLHMYIPRT